MLKQIGLCVAIVMAGAGVGTMRAAVVYDSAGFELPRFQAAPLVGTNALAGQDPAPPVGQGPWQQDAGTSSAVVQTNSVKSGLQSVYVQRLSGATGDTRWWVPVAVTPTVSDPAVDLSFDMDVNISATLTYGPRFGVEAYDDTGAAPKLIGEILLDASQGTLLYASGGSGAITSSGVFLSRNQYHHFSLVSNFADKNYSIFADGTLLHTEPFVDPSATAFSRGAIVARSAVTDTETGKAYFDNYTIATAVPEPNVAELLAAAAAAAGLAQRRR